MESRRRDAAEDDEDWSERAIEKEEEVERGGRGRASETAEGASVDAGKDEKLPLSSGGGGGGNGGGVAVSVLGVRVRGIAFFLPFPSSSLFPRRKWPLDVTVIILRASLARKNERTRERAKERESDARTAAAAAPTKMPVGGGREGGREAKGRASERVVIGWAGCNCSQAREEERGRDWTATGARGQAKRSLLSGLAWTFEVLGCRVK